MTDTRGPAARLLQWLLRLFPQEFRGDFAEQIHLDFADQCQAVRAGGGRASLIRLWAATVAGILRQAPREHAEVLVRDVRYALRALVRAPGFSGVAVLVLAIGIGGNSAVFTLVNALLLEPVMGRSPDVVAVLSRERSRPDSYRSFSYPNYLDVRLSSADVFDGVFAHTFATVAIESGGSVRRSVAEVVSANYFDTLRVPLALGRSFSAEEEKPGAGLPVAIVPYAHWENAGLDPGFLGTILRINSTAFTVIGVTPKGFGGTMAVASPDLWLPLGVYEGVVQDMFRHRRAALMDRNNATLVLAARLRPGISREAADARLDTLSRRLEAAYPAENRDQLLSVHPLSRLSISDEPVSDTPVAAGAAILLALSGCVLLIASLNLANMLLARGAARRKELAIRRAIGGSRRRIVRQLLTERLVLALIGAAVGLALSSAAVRLLVRTLAPVVPLTLRFDPAPDASVVVATFGFAAAAVLMFGLVPALRLSRRDLVTDFKDLPGDSPRGGRRLTGRNAMVVAQLSLSLALLSCGGLFARHALEAASSTPGFSYDGQIIFSIDPSLSRHEDERTRRIYAAVLERLRRVPGIAAVSLASTVPYSDVHEGHAVDRAGAAAVTGASRSPTFRVIGADYFRTLGIPVLRGREFSPAEEESASAPRVAIVDSQLAARLFPGEDALGQLVRLAPQGDHGVTSDTDPLEIVGIVAPLREQAFDAQPGAHIYVPFARHFRPAMYVHVRSASATEAALAAVVNEIRETVRGVDPALPLMDLSPLGQFQERSIIQWGIRSGARMLGTFGLLALLLAVIGLYGLKSYVVSLRRREIGIRMALGASPRDVHRMVMGQAAVLIGLGLAIGLPLSLALGRGMNSLLFSVQSSDPLVLAVSALALAAAAATASYLPARRAALLDPRQTLQ